MTSRLRRMVRGSAVRAHSGTLVALMALGALGVVVALGVVAGAAVIAGSGSSLVRAERAQGQSALGQSAPGQSAPAQSVPGLVLDRQVGGAFGAMVVGFAAEKAFVEIGSTLTAVDPSTLASVGTVPAPAGSRPLASTGTRLMVASGNRVLVFDTTLADEIPLTATADLSEPPISAAADGERGFVVTASGLIELDLASAGTPALTWLLTEPDIGHVAAAGGQVWSTVGERLVRLAEEDGVWREAASVELPVEPGILSVGGATDDERLVAVGYGSQLSFYGALDLFPRGAVELPGEVSAVGVANGAALAAVFDLGDGPGLVRVDLAGPGAPVTGATSALADAAIAIQVHESGLLVSALRAGLLRLQIGPSADLEVLQSRPALATATGVAAVTGGLVAINEWGPAAGVWLIRTGEGETWTLPSEPELLLPGIPEAIAADGSRVAIATGGSVELIAVEGEGLSSHGRLDVGGPVAALVVRPGRLYVAVGARVLVADISDPGAPAVLGAMDQPGIPADLAEEDRYVFVVGDGVDGAPDYLEVIEAVQPDAPLSVARLELDDASSHSAAVRSRHVLLDDLSVVAFDPVAGLTTLTTLRESAGRASAVGGSTLAIVGADGGGSARAYDVTEADAPRALPIAVVIQEPLSVAVDGSRVYYGTQFDGVYILEPGFVAAPTATPPEPTATTDPLATPSPTGEPGPTRIYLPIGETTG